MTDMNREIFDMTLEELMQVEVITAARQSEKLSDTIATTYVINGEELRALGARTIYDALMQVPGITVAGNKGGANKVFMRGAGSEYSSQILFMIDSHIINSTIDGGIGIMIDRLPVENIKRIEVVHGPVSSLYGANAFLGLINIITLKGDEIDGVQGRFRAEFDDNGHAGNSYNILAGKGFGEDWQASINLHASNGDGPELPVEQDLFGRSGYADNMEEYYDLYFRLENREFQLNGRYNYRRGGGWFGIGNVLNDGSNIESTDIFLDSTYSLTPYDDLRIDFRGYVDHISFDGLYELIPADSIPPGFPLYPWIRSDYKSRIKGDNNKYGAELHAIWKGIGGHTFNFGISYLYQELRNPETYANIAAIVPVHLSDLEDISDRLNWIGKASRNSYGFYFQDTWNITERFSGTVSGRYDYYTDFGSTFNPRVGLLYRFSDSYQVRALYGRAFRAPDFGSQFIKNNIVTQGNPDLEPEYINTFELGFRGTVNEHLFVEATLFRNELEDMIDLNNSMPRVFQNINDVTVNGVELAVRINFGNGMKLKAEYSWADVDASSTYSAVSVPSNKGSLAFDWDIGRFFHWNINFYAQDRSPREGNDSRSDLDGYMLLNTALEARLNRYVSMDFSIFNMTDEDYAYPAPARTFKYDYTAAGRTFLVGLRLTY
jgi:iron complex outermembrane receptor protein